MRGSLAAVLSVVMLGCGGVTPTGAGSAVSPPVPSNTPTAAPTPTNAQEGTSADQVAHIVAAIDELTFLSDIVPEEGEDVTDAFVAWINREADWVTTEMDAAMKLDPARAEYVSALTAARQKVADGNYVLPSGQYEFGPELETILGLRDRIAATTNPP